MSKEEKNSPDTVEGNKEHLGEVINRVIDSLKDCGTIDAGVAIEKINKSKHDHEALSDVCGFVEKVMEMNEPTLVAVTRTKDVVEDLKTACALLKSGDKAFGKINKAHKNTMGGKPFPEDKRFKDWGETDGGNQPKEAVPDDDLMSEMVCLRIEFGQPPANEDSDITIDGLSFASDALMELIDGDTDDINSSLTDAMGEGSPVYFFVDEEVSVVKDSIKGFPEWIVGTVVPIDEATDADTYPFSRDELDGIGE